MQSLGRTNISTHVHAPATELFGQGSTAAVVFFLESGWVKFTSVDVTGVEAIVGIQRHPGPMGLTEALLQLPYAATATTMTRCCTQCMPVSDLATRLGSSPLLARELLLWQSTLLYESTVHITELTCLRARRRLERFLWELLDEGNTNVDKIRVKLPLKKCDLAKYIGATPEHLSRLLTRMVREGVLQRDRRWLIVNAAKLDLHLLGKARWATPGVTQSRLCD